MAKSQKKRDIPAGATAVATNRVARRDYDILDEIWPATTNITFQILVMDQGDPIRGTRASATVEVSNTCLIDTEYFPIDYNFDVDSTNGTMHLRVPGYFHADFCK